MSLRRTMERDAHQGCPPSGSTVVGWFLVAQMIFNVFGVNICSQRPTAAQLVGHSVTSRAGCVGLVVRKLISTAKRRAPATTRSSLSTRSKCRRTEIPTNLTLATRVTHVTCYLRVDRPRPHTALVASPHMQKKRAAHGSDSTHLYLSHRITQLPSVLHHESPSASGIDP
jgi:hypothetical protein